MRTSLRIIAACTAMLLASLAVASPILSATLQDATVLRVGLVGRLSSLADLTDGGVTSNLVMSMVADSLFSYSIPDRSVSPMLAEGWPDFAADGKSVKVKVRSGIDPSGSGLFGLQAVASALQSRVPSASGATVQADEAGNSLVFRFTSDASLFWDLFAFVPVYAVSADGCPVGAGDPAYRFGTIESGGVVLHPNGGVSLPVLLRGYKDQVSMIQAFTEGAIDYCSTDLSRSSAQLKGPNWQSSPEAAVVLVLNPGSAAFSEAQARSSALNLIDRPYIVLRTIPGRAIQSTGLYFSSNPSTSGSIAMDGKAIRLISKSDRLDSLEMLCSMMVKAWWEADGALVSLNLPSDKLNARARLEAGDYDAIVATVWLRPGFTGLLDNLADGGLMQEYIKSDAASILKRLKAPKSFDDMKKAAEELEGLLINRSVVLPLVRPVKTELYRPQQFAGWRSAAGEPLIHTYRDFSGIYAIKP
ncbi:MAG TPA: hypothetical protein PKJ05_03960 [Bacillota bacterium]|nr:hypothetical protein [Bacillota bacterium]